MFAKGHKIALSILKVYQLNVIGIKDSIMNGVQGVLLAVAVLLPSITSHGVSNPFPDESYYQKSIGHNDSTYLVGFESLFLSDKDDYVRRMERTLSDLSQPCKAHCERYVYYLKNPSKAISEGQSWVFKSILYDGAFLPIFQPFFSCSV